MSKTFCVFLFTLFLAVLKLTGQIDWEWVYVIMPMMLWGSIFLAALLALFIFLIFVDEKDRRSFMQGFFEE